MPGKYPTPDDGRTLPARKKPGAGPGMLPGPLRRLLSWHRNIRNDPFYHAERRQQLSGRSILLGLVVGIPVLLFALLLTACCMPFGLMLLAVGPSLFGAILAAEGILGEIEGRTLDALLLTTTSRHRILWAKTLARIRPVRVLAIIGMALGIAAGIISAIFIISAERHPTTRLVLFAVAVAVVSSGSLGYALVANTMGQGISGAAFGVYSVLLGRRRMPSYLFMMLWLTLLAGAEGILGGVFGVITVMATALLSENVDVYGPGLALMAVSLAGAVFVSCKFVLVNLLLPKAIMSHCSQTFDRTFTVDA